MKRFFLFAALLTIAVLPQTASAQLNNVFASGQTQNSAPEAAPSIDLKSMLESKGFTLKESSQDTICALSFKSGEITYPIVVYLTDSKKAVWLKIGLDNVPGNAGDYTDKILRLMELNGTYGPVFYSYNSKTRLISLFSSIMAAEVSAESLEARIKLMVAQADVQMADWNGSQWTTARHIGSWSAEIGQQASIVINLRADGSFDLTNKANGSVTTITGQYQLESGTLKMKDTQGNEIAGAIQFVNGNEFKLNVNNQDLNFERS